MRRLLPAALAALVLAGCGRLDHFGRAPELSVAGAEGSGAPAPAPERVALVPPAPAPPPASETASLWHAGPSSLFGDRRARRRGDILTVLVEIDDEGQIENATERNRAGSEQLEIAALLGLPALADVALPGAGTLNPAIGIGSDSASSGDGSIDRQEEISTRLAATVERVLPNGHLVIRGSQEVRVNFELRELLVSGIVRPEDISRRNEIAVDKIADTRIVYGGRGQITDLQQPRYGQQAVDLVAPF